MTLRPAQLVAAFGLLVLCFAVAPRPALADPPHPPVNCVYQTCVVDESPGGAGQTIVPSKEYCADHTCNTDADTNVQYCWAQPWNCAYPGLNGGGGGGGGAVSLGGAGGNGDSGGTGGCDPSYPDVCLLDGIGDWDCIGDGNQAPNIYRGPPLRVLPPDPFGLDRDHDGIGCEDNPK